MLLFPHEAVITVLLQLVVLAIVAWEKLPMPRKGAKNANNERDTGSETTEEQDILGDDVVGDFGEIPQQFATTIGVIARLSVVKGGYFGISVTDDRVSCRLVVHTGKRKLDKRFYRLTDVEAALAKCLAVLRE